MYKYDDKTKTLTVTKYNDLWYYSFLEEKKDFIQKIVINDTEHIEPYDLSIRAQKTPSDEATIFLVT